MIAVTWGSATDQGRVRARNEDSLLARAPVFVVADGMGGHRGGATASDLAVRAFHAILDRQKLTARDVATAIQTADDTIRARAKVDPSVSTMGTTAAGIVLFSEEGDDYWLAFNIGDSRIYRLHDGALTQISVDHSYVQELVIAGFIEPHEARTHPERCLVTRVLGGRGDVIPDFWMFPPEPGERFLICSDGLCGELDDDVIGELLASSPDPQDTAWLLVEAANDAGGSDNITVIVVDVDGSESSGLEVPTVDRDRTGEDPLPEAASPSPGPSVP
jgi:serine/threonine protein phosphatase PrpC